MPDAGSRTAHAVPSKAGRRSTHCPAETTPAQQVSGITDLRRTRHRSAPPKKKESRLGRLLNSTTSAVPLCMSTSEPRTAAFRSRGGAVRCRATTPCKSLHAPAIHFAQHLLSQYLRQRFAAETSTRGKMLISIPNHLRRLCEFCT